MLKGIVNGVEKDIIRVPMIVNGVEKEGWEIRDQQGRFIWWKNITLTGVVQISFIGYGVNLVSYEFDGNTTEKNAKPTTNPSSFDPAGFGDKTENYLPSPESETKTQDGITIVCDGNGGYTISRSSGYSTTPTIWFDIQPTPMTGEPMARVSLFNTTSADIIFVAMDSRGYVHEYPLSPAYAVSDIGFMERKVITKVGFQFTSSDSISTVKLSPQVTDSKRNTYIPYGYVIPISVGTQTKNIYLKSPCYKLDSNADRLLNDRVVRKIMEYTLTGNESWYMYQASNVLQFYTSGLNLGAVSGSSAMSNIAKYGATASDQASYQYGCYTVSNGYDIGFQMYGSSSSFPDVEAWKTYLQNNYNQGTPVRFWYILETEKTESIASMSIPAPVGENTITTSTTLQPTYISITGHIKEPIYHYGFKIDKTQSDPFQNVTYLYDAVGYTPAKMNYTSNEFEYGSWENAFFIRDAYPVALKFDGTEDYRLDKNDYSKKTDGTASDISNSSYAGNFMMAIPTVWFKRYDDEDYNYIEISSEQLDSDFHAYAHTDRNGVVKDHIYLPLFKGSLINGRIRSVVDAVPQSNISLENLESYVSANGDGWQMWDHSSRELICDLLTLIGKSTDSQTTFGKGQVLGYDSSAVDSGFVHTGSLKDKGMFFGYNTDYSDVKVFGIEGFWGTRLDFIQGLMIRRRTDYFSVKMRPPYYLDGVGYDESISIPSQEGFLMTLRTSALGSVPYSVDGTSSTYFCDFCTGRTDTRYADAYPCVGGTAGTVDDGTNGYRYINTHPDKTTAYPNVGCSIIYK